MGFNPWATKISGAAISDKPEYPDAVMSRYAAPKAAADAPYMDNPSGGWAPGLSRVPGGTPDPGRLGTLPLYETQPRGNQPPQEFYEGFTGKETGLRESVTRQSAVGWDETKGIDTGRRFAPNPRETPPPENRVTQRMSPATYTFWRPFGTNSAKQTAARLNGSHFSMADHRRNYPILGMNEQRKPGAGTRNTYRLAPVPWDSNIVDVPPDTAAGLPQEQLIAPINSATGRSWRLS